MSTTKSGYVNGSDILLMVGGKCIGHCTSHSLSFSSETKERAVKPVSTATVSASLWKSKTVTGLSISISADGLHFYAETEEGAKGLLGKWYEGKSVEVKCIEREGDTTPYLVGNFVIDSVEVSAPAQDDTTYSVSLSNDGAPTTFTPANLS